MQSKSEMHRMKKLLLMLVACLILLAACHQPKAYYKTRQGRKKQKYYNDIQFGGKSPAQMRKN